VVVAPFVLGRRVAVLGCVVVVAVIVVARPPSPGWPPPGWLMVACDVGQGDALVLNAGDRSAVVVDAGPDPAAADRCLRDLDVERIPLLVVSHFHADHVDGLPGLVRGREVGEVVVTGLGEPEGGRRLVSAVARELGLVPRVAEAGTTRSVGPVALQTLWPPAEVRRLGDAGSVENNVSVVLLAEVAGVRVLLTGDVEPEAQAAIARAWPGLESQVVKVPHHGSRFQDLRFLESLGSRVALVSVGVDNDYGHPAEELLSGLEGSGAEVLRTDRQGDLAVVLRSGELATVAREAG
jgi:competence protein ComEC